MLNSPVIPVAQVACESVDDQPEARFPDRENWAAAPATIETNFPIGNI